MKESSKKNIKVTPIIIIAVCVAIIIALFFMLKGSTTTSGKYPEDVVSTSLSCSKNDAFYPFFDYDNADSKEIKINATFNQDIIESISLIARLYYSSSDKIVSSEAVNHAAMNKSFGFALGPDALGASYAKLKDAFKMSLFAEKKDINADSARFLLISPDPELPQTMSDYRKNYEQQGYVCKTIE